MAKNKIRVAFFDAKPYDRESFAVLNQEYGVDIVYFENRLTVGSAAMAQGFEVVCAFVNDEIDRACIEKLVLGGVNLLAMRCAGYNNVDLSAALGVLPIVRVPEYSPHAVAEYTMGLMLCLNRYIHRAFCRVRENNFSINGFQGFDVYGKTVGVVGTGKIGRTFAELFKGFGVRLLGYDLYPNREWAKATNLEYVSLPDLYAASDVISLHCPLTPENRHMINEQSLSLMKPGVMLLNTSRGKLIDSAALIQALKSGQVGAAGLDVYEEESEYFFEDRSNRAIDDDILARLLTFPNVIVTSHQAFLTREALGNIAGTTLENIKLYFRNGSLPNGVCNNCAGGKCGDCGKK